MRNLLCLSWVMSLAACSGPVTEEPANAVDVEAAASRAQSDIANYAAGTGHRTTRAIPKPAPLPSAALPKVAPGVR
jgi:hypothetical protein